MEEPIGSITEKPRFVWCWTRNKAIPAAQWAAELYDLHVDEDEIPHVIARAVRNKRD